MDAAAVTPPKRSQLLLEHCLAFAGDEAAGRPTAAARLEALLGRDLARRLVRALSSRTA